MERCGSPALAELLEGRLVWDGLEAQGLGGRDLQGAVADGPQVGSAEAGEQVDVGGPAADAGQRHEVVPHRLVVEVPQPVEVEVARLDRGGQGPQVAVLLAGDPVEPQLLGRRRQQRAGFIRPVRASTLR